MAPRRTCLCGSCQKCRHREYMNNYYRLNPDKIRSIALRSRTRRIESVRVYDRARPNRQSPEQKRAVGAVHNALKRGRMERPAACSECNESPPPAVDGRSQIEAHHEDYSKPLDVVWLCKTCHMKRHRQVAA